MANRHITPELYLTAVSIVMAVGLINLGDLVSFFEAIIPKGKESILDSGLVYLFVASYLLYFATIFLALVPLLRWLAGYDDSLDPTGIATLLTIAILAVLTSYAAMFLRSMLRMHETFRGS